MEKIRDTSMGIYNKGRDMRSGRGSLSQTPSLNLAGMRTGTSFLIDEVLTPDSSRFWPADDWEAGPGTKQL